MKLTVTLPDGNEHEVESSALTLPDGAQLIAKGETPDGYVTKAYHDSRLEETGRDASASLKQAKRQLRDDAEFRAEIAAQIKAESAPETEAAITAARKKWDDEVLAPVQERLTTFTEGLRKETLLSTLRGMKDEDGRPLIREEFLTRTGDAPSYAETVLGRFVAIGDDGRPRAVDAEGNPLPSAEAGRAYASPAEHLRQLVTSDDYAHLRPAPPAGQRGAGYRGSSGAAPTGLKRSQMSAKQKVDYQREHGAEALQALPYD